MLPIYARHLHRYHLDQSLYWLKAQNQIRNTWKHKQILRAWRLIWKRQLQSRREDCSLAWSHPESSPLLQKAPNHVTERCFCWFCQAVDIAFDSEFNVQNCAKACKKPLLILNLLCQIGLRLCQAELLEVLWRQGWSKSHPPWWRPATVA